MTTTTDTAPTPTAIADVLDKAADHMDKVGHHKGYLYADAQADRGTPLKECQVDAVGAIYVVVHGVPRSGITDPAALGVAMAALDALRDHVGSTVIGWNDRPERTMADVTTALRATAAGLRGESA